MNSAQQKHDIISFDVANLDFSLWRGKTWPEHPPVDLNSYVDDLLAVPKAALSPSLPVPPTTPPTQFIDIPFPSVTSDIITGKDIFWFHRDRPTTDLRDILQRPIPSRSLVERMAEKKRIGQLILDGYISISDPRTNEGKDRFPLAALAAWMMIHMILEAQERWRAAIAHVKSNLGVKSREVAAAAQDAMDMLGRMGWNESLAAKIPPLALTRFLGSGWLNDDVVNLQVEYMKARLTTEPPKGVRIGFAPLLFTNKLLFRNIAKDWLGRQKVFLPALNAWMPDLSMPLSESDGDVSDNESDGADELLELLDRVDADDVREAMSRKQIKQTQQLSSAAAALLVDDFRTVQMFANPNEAELEADEQLLADQVSELDDYLNTLARASLKPVVTHPSIFGQAGAVVTSPTSFDFSELISLRLAHQTAQAVTGVRVRSNQADDSLDSQGQGITARHEIIRQLHAVLKECEDGLGLTTGVGRKIRTHALGSSTAEPTVATGNSANAALAATVRSGVSLVARRKLYEKVGVPPEVLHIIELGRVSMVSPLLPLQWALVAVDRDQPHQHDIYLAQVLTQYTRSGGKNGKHVALVDVGQPNIAAASYITVKIYAFESGPRVFSPITDQLELLGCATFVHLPPIQFLVKTQQPLVANDGRAALSHDALSIFQALRRERISISAAIKASRARKQADEADE
ncbi:hypothetical protein GGX14DRAFT_637126 [Mycena pura]|uniref:Uncharacterized protein n=1 Tax=Mycena pura TaxID=153505 RepID=A0AAD6YDA7_9AGAR|nr:hypothetical protein GGX14DRAFT_637126 [Mycena pura]